MVFSQITFLFYFLPIFLSLYFLFPGIYGKNTLILLFSILFYAWGEPYFVFVLLLIIAFNYMAGRAIDRSPDAVRPYVTASGVIANLLTLATFKYLDFFVANLNGLAGFDVIGIKPL